jgi:hypothetical protein
VAAAVAAGTAAFCRRRRLAGALLACCLRCSCHSRNACHSVSHTCARLASSRRSKAMNVAIPTVDCALLDFAMMAVRLGRATVPKLNC